MAQKWVNGVQLGYEQHGRGLPLVLLHGFGLNRTIWRQMALTHLAQVRVILPDVRGHGQSAAPVGAYSMTALAEDVAGLLDALKIDRAVVAGHSMGGYISLAFAQRFPDRLLGLGLITTRSESDSVEKAAGRHQMVDAVTAQGSIALADSLAPRLTDDSAVVDAMHALIASTSPAGIIGVLKGMASRPDRTALLETIRVPALVAAGESDQIIDFARSRRMAERLPAGTFLSLPCAHMPMLEAPSQLAQGLRDLMGRINTP